METRQVNDSSSVNCGWATNCVGSGWERPAVLQARIERTNNATRPFLPPAQKDENATADNTKSARFELCWSGRCKRWTNSLDEVMLTVTFAFAVGTEIALAGYLVAAAVWGVSVQ